MGRAELTSPHALGGSRVRVFVREAGREGDFVLEAIFVRVRVGVRWSQ